MTLFRSLTCRWPFYVALLALAAGVSIAAVPLQSLAQAPVEDKGVPPQVRQVLRTVTAGDLKWTLYSGKTGGRWCLDAEATGPGNQPLGSVGGCGLAGVSGPVIESILSGQGLKTDDGRPQLITLDGYVNVDRAASKQHVAFGLASCDCRVEMESGSGTIADKVVDGAFLLSAPGSGSDSPAHLRVIDQTGKVVAERP